MGFVWTKKCTTEVIAKVIGECVVSFAIINASAIPEPMGKSSFLRDSHPEIME